MAATHTTWIRSASTVLFLVLTSWTVQAQSTMPIKISKRVVKDADREMSLNRFAEAHERYRAVAMSDLARANMDSAFAPRLDVFAKAIDCAMRAGLPLGAMELLDTLIVADMATPEQWTVRIELALQQGNATDTQALVTEGKRAVNNPVWSQSVDALFARSAEAQRRETRADIKRTRFPT